MPSGDAFIWRKRNADFVVSIRARRCRRAMHSIGAEISWQSPVSIRARRCRRAMPWTGQLTRQPLNCFNPRPTLPSGDAAVAREAMSAIDGFNPRPTLPSGDALLSRSCRGAFMVSIRARRCRRAMLFARN